MALTNDDLQAIGQMMDEKLGPIHTRLDKMDDRLDSIEDRLGTIEEDTKITREAVHTLIERVDTATLVVEIRYPVKHRKVE